MYFRSVVAFGRSFTSSPPGSEEGLVTYSDFVEVVNTLEKKVVYL